MTLIVFTALSPILILVATLIEMARCPEGMDDSGNCIE